MEGLENKIDDPYLNAEAFILDYLTKKNPSSFREIDTKENCEKYNVSSVYMRRAVWSLMDKRKIEFTNENKLGLV